MSKKTFMDYSQAKDWILAETDFNAELLGKCEAVMCQGNGYMGLRCATEERYLGEQRNLFVAGTFNKFDDNEVTELPNAADLLNLSLRVDGQLFDLTQGSLLSYRRTLNLRTGEVVRTVRWQAPAGQVLDLEFRRIVSFERLHVLAQKVTLRADRAVQLAVESGINGQMTNTGSQHFSEGQKRLYDGTVMQYTQTTTQSKIDFFFNTRLRFFKNGAEQDLKGFITMDRRRIDMRYTLDLQPGETLDIEKVSTVHTSRDRDAEGVEFAAMQQRTLADARDAQAQGYDALAAESAAAWNRRVWDRVAVQVESADEFDALALHFAQYHLYVMTPAHDNRMNVGAKGLSGEAYKGHTFWDTEMFILPYFNFTDPAIAKSLEEYRYLSLPGAHKKAASNNYKGAQFPWEAAWLDDGEVTPVWGAADIVTGLPTKIWSGFIEEHITADVVYGLWQYCTVTGDEKFMEDAGYELMMDTAIYWVSRMTEQADGKLHILDVVGPDEYKEHVDDNAFTNYMAHWNIRKAIEYHDLLKAEKPELFARLDKKLGLAEAYAAWTGAVDRILLPQPREDGVIPQNATYLQLKDVDLTKYKNQDHVGSLFEDYNLEQVNQMQVSKQADILLLFLLMENLFSHEVKQANWDYYEPRTLHDSSLSLSTHCILANDMHNRDLAYRLFRQAAAIDAGPDMKSSSAGIHAASIAGIWQCAVFGFGGVRMLDGRLRIRPALPEAWSRLEFCIFWHGQKLHVVQTHSSVTVENLTGTSLVELELNGEQICLEGSVTRAL